MRGTRSKKSRPQGISRRAPDRLSVHIASMFDEEDRHFPFSIIYSEYDTVIADTHAPGARSTHFSHSRRPRFLRKLNDHFVYSAAHGRRKRPNLFLRRSLDSNAVGHNKPSWLISRAKSLLSTRSSMSDMSSNSSGHLESSPTKARSSGSSRSFSLCASSLPPTA